MDVTAAPTRVRPFTWASRASAEYHWLFSTDYMGTDRRVCFGKDPPAEASGSDRARNWLEDLGSRCCSKGAVGFWLKGRMRILNMESRLLRSP